MKKWKKGANRDFSCLWIGRVNIVTITFLNSVCVHMHVGECMYLSHCICVEVRGPLWDSREESSMWVLGKNSGYQTWWRVPLSPGHLLQGLQEQVCFIFFFFQCGYSNANLVRVTRSYFMGVVIVILTQTRVTWEEVASLNFSHQIGWSLVISVKWEGPAHCRQHLLP